MKTNTVGEDPKNLSLRRQLNEVLNALGQELLPEDRLVAEAFLSTDRHLSVTDMEGMLAGAAEPIDASHVRRTLRLLTELGIAHRLNLGEQTVYEHLHPGNHHDHLICTRCGKIEEFVSERIEEAQFEACRRAGFQPLMHTLVIRGICRDCAKRIPPTRLLASCLAGEEVEVCDVVGGRGIKQRLHALGFIGGTVVRILRNDGPVVVDVRGSRIAVGRGEAMKVVTRVPGQAIEGEATE